MTYLGTVKVENGQVVWPEAFSTEGRPATYDAVEVGGIILLSAAPLDRERMRQVESLADQSIADHRTSPEGLAR